MWDPRSVADHAADRAEIAVLDRLHVVAEGLGPRGQIADGTERLIDGPLHVSLNGGDRLVGLGLEELLRRLGRERQNRLERVAVHLELIAGHGGRGRAAHGEPAHRVDLEVARASDAHRLVGADGVHRALGDLDLLIRAHLQLGVDRDHRRLVVADRLLLVVRGSEGHVLLRVDHDLLRARLVLEADLVDATAAGTGLGLDRRARLALGERIGRLERGVVEPTGHHGAIGIALHVLHHDLPVVAGQHQRPGCLQLRHTHPTRRRVVELAVAVPVEVDLDPTVLVGVNRLALRALRRHHHRGLRPVNDGFGRRLLGSIDDLLGDERRLHGVVHAIAFSVSGDVVEGLRRGDDEVFAVEIAGVDDLDDASGVQPRTVTLDVQGAAPRLLGLEPHLGEPLALGRLAVVAGVIVDLEVGVRIRLRGAKQIERRVLEVVVAQGDRTRPHPLDVGRQSQRVLVNPELTPRSHRERRSPFQGRGRGAVIGEDHRVAVVTLLDEVMDPLLFEQPLDKVQTALLVLHAVGTLGVGTGEAPFHRRDATLGQELLDDLFDVELLEDARVDITRQQRDLRHDLEDVLMGGLGGEARAHHRRVLDDAGEDVSRISREAVLEPRGMPEQVAQRDVVRHPEFDAKRRWPTEPFDLPKLDDAVDDDVVDGELGA